MGCCGRGASVKSKNQAFAVSQMASTEIALDGFSEIAYIGNRSSGERFNVYGCVTGTMYRVTPGKTFMVDNQDLVGGTAKYPCILEMYEGNKLMFELVVAQPEIVQVGSVTTLSAESTVNKMVYNTTKSTVDNIVDFTPLDGILSNLDYALKTENYTLAQLEKLWAYELANQNRKGAFTRIETAMEILKNG